MAPEAQVVNEALKFALEKSVRASTGVYDLIKVC